MKTKEHLDNLLIASPCPTSWEQMSGDDRVRFCDSCNLHVYNIARLTRREAESLISNAEGRVCAKLYRRADGTIITKDCPVGLRAIRRRAARITGAVFATIVGLCSVVVGQKPSRKDKAACHQQVTISRSDSQTEVSLISGTILDPNGAVIAGAVIAVTSGDKNSAIIETKTDADGFFRIAALPSGSYNLKVQAAGFKSLVISDIKLAKKESVQLKTTLLLADTSTMTMGIIAGTELLKTDLTVFSGDLIRRLPIH